LNGRNGSDGTHGVLVCAPGLLHLEAFAVDAQPFGPLIVAAQTGYVVTEGAQAIPLFAAIRIAVQLADGQGIPGGDEGGEMVGQGTLAGLGDFAGFGQEAAGLSEGILLEEPGGVVAFFPFGEVGLGNRMAGKGGGQDLPDFRAGVEPGDDLSALLAVAQTEVDLLAEVMGQPGDFTLRGGGHGSIWLNLLEFA